MRLAQIATVVLCLAVVAAPSAGAPAPPRLGSYFAKVRDEIQRAERHEKQALRIWSDGIWESADAARVRRLAVELERITSRLAALRPSRGLVEAHGALVRSVHFSSRGLRELAVTINGTGERSR